MGQFLATGLTFRITTNKQEAMQKQVSANDILQKIEKKLDFPSSVFELKEQGDNWVWEIKPTELLSFLEVFYPDFYQGKPRQYQEALTMLRENEPEKWYEIAEEEGFSEFQMGEIRFSRLGFGEKTNNQEIRICFETLILALDGKISFEELDNTLNFCNKAIKKSYPQFPVSKLLVLYVTG